MDSTCKLLRHYLDTGYCLHGTPVMGLKTIEPRQARSAKNGADQNQYAIYADPLGIRRPLIHATVTYQCPGPWSWRYSADGAEEPLEVTGENVTFGFGSVYVLEQTTFFQHGAEFISRKSVSVLTEVLVGPAQIVAIREKYALRIPIPPPWR